MQYSSNYFILNTSRQELCHLSDKQVSFERNKNSPVGKRWRTCARERVVSSGETLFGSCKCIIAHECTAASRGTGAVRITGIPRPRKYRWNLFFPEMKHSVGVSRNGPEYFWYFAAARRFLSRRNLLTRNRRGECYFVLNILPVSRDTCPGNRKNASARAPREFDAWEAWTMLSPIEVGHIKEFGDG